MLPQLWFFYKLSRTAPTTRDFGVMERLRSSVFFYGRNEVCPFAAVPRSALGFSRTLTRLSHSRRQPPLLFGRPVPAPTISPITGRTLNRLVRSWPQLPPRHHVYTTRETAYRIPPRVSITATNGATVHQSHMLQCRTPRVLCGGC